MISLSGAYSSIKKCQNTYKYEAFKRHGVGLTLLPWSLHDSSTYAHQLHVSTQQACTCMPLPQTYVHTYMVHTHTHLYLLLLFLISIFSYLLLNLQLYIYIFRIITIYLRYPLSWTYLPISLSLF